jgi:tRNA threonylcarbamoyladenosine biosynthesis protein TsaE
VNNLLTNLFSVVSESPGETLRIARDLGKACKAGDSLALEGSLGSGKTLFVHGLAQGLKIRRPKDVRSPTFSLIHEYKGKIPLCHADLYRLQSAETMDLGLEDYWKEGLWVTVVEWADRSKGLLPASTLHIKFKILSPTNRRLNFWGPTEWKKKIPL